MASGGTPTQIAGPRPWNPSFKHSDRERWICIYPAYINSRKTLKEGRRVPKEKGVDNPTYTEIRDVCANAGMILGVENKVYPRELDHKDLKFRGRIRIQLRNEEGAPMMEKFPTRQSVLLFLGETIPKLKSRLQAANQASSQAASQRGPKGKKGRKGK